MTGFISGTRPTSGSGGGNKPEEYLHKPASLDLCFCLVKPKTLKPNIKMDCALNTKEMTNNQKSKSQQGHKAAFSRRPSFDHLDAGYESHYSSDKDSVRVCARGLEGSKYWRVI